MTAAGPEPDSRIAASFRGWVFQDWRVNAGRKESQLILAWFRAAQWALEHWGRPGKRFVDAYRLLTSMLLTVELPAQSRIGPRVRLFHPHGVVIHPDVRIGADCAIRQNVTIGNTQRRSGESRGCPSLGDGVDLGAGCMLLGPIRVGDRTRVGALTLVLRDVPAYSVVVGNPARILRTEEPGS
jgi:putative colanic acid biosynthesis acetyltransferase WcaB